MVKESDRHRNDPKTNIVDDATTRWEAGRVITDGRNAASSRREDSGEAAAGQWTDLMDTESQQKSSLSSSRVG